VKLFGCSLQNYNSSPINSNERKFIRPFSAFNFPLNHDTLDLSSTTFYLASSSNDNNENNSKDDAMDSAFESLNSLSSDDFGIESKSAISPNGDITNVDKISATPEELKLYSDMYQELESDGEKGIYDRILGDLQGEDSTNNGVQSEVEQDNYATFDTIEERLDAVDSSLLEDADGIGIFGAGIEDLSSTTVDTDINILDSEDTDAFMKKAFEEALDDARRAAPLDNIATDPQSILNDQEMLREINDVFDRANDKLLAGLAEIREEQEAMTRASAAKREKAREFESQRLAEAEGSISRLVDKVKEETEAVQVAMKDLEDAQQQLGDDPLIQAVDLKSAGLVKQGALVGTVLFSLRSFGDFAMLAGPSGQDHLFPAASQAIIAVVCAILFFFL